METKTITVIVPEPPIWPLTPPEAQIEKAPVRSLDSSLAGLRPGDSLVTPPGPPAGGVK